MDCRQSGAYRRRVAGRGFRGAEAAVKREDLPSSEVLASIGLAAAGALAGLVARALVLGGKVVAAGLETIEHAVATDRASDPSSSATVTHLRDRRDERSAEDVEAAPWADGVDALPTDPDFAVFEPADGLTPTSTTRRPAPRRSSAGGAPTTPRRRRRPPPPPPRPPASPPPGRPAPPPPRPAGAGPPVPDVVPDAEPAAPS